MNAVGIDVSKGKSMVAALRPMGEVALRPKEYVHTEVGLEQMALDILALGEDTRALMEATGRYHEPVAAALHEYGIRVTVINPLFIKQSGGGSIRKVKTDKADAMKIAKYALDNWVELREYTPMEAIREQLKLCSRQYNLYMKNVVALQNNLISLTDKTFPGVNELFSSPDRADGSQKLMAEIGDVRRFPRRSSIVSFAGVDPAVDDSGKHISKSNPTTKRGSPHLRKTLYQIACTYLRRAPADEPVYQFLDKKRAEGKPYFVYMTAAQNMFLRIYYARVKECLAAAR